MHEHGPGERSAPGGVGDPGGHIGPGDARDPIEVIAAQVSVLLAEEPSDLPLGALEDRLVALRRQLDRLEAVFARDAAVGHTRGAGSADGAVSTAAWLRHRTGMRAGEARGAIEAGRLHEVLPAIAAAWEAGEISEHLARLIAAGRIEGADELFATFEARLLDAARSGSVREVQAELVRFAELADPDGRPPRRTKGLYLSRTFGGVHVLSGELTGADAEMVLTALHRFCDPPSDDDARSRPERMRDALVRVCRIALGTGTIGKAARPAASLVLDWDAVTAGRPGRVDGEFTGPMSVQEIRRLLCDAEVSRVVTGPDSLPLDVGRAARTAPDHLRRAVVVRDGGCCFPGCDRPPAWCEVHHRRHWLDGGETSLDNSDLLCDRHHTVVHRDQLVIERDRHGARVFRPDGSEILSRPRAA